MCDFDRSDFNSSTGRAHIRKPSSVSRKVRSHGTVICWLNGIPGNVMPWAQPIWIRRPFGASL